MLGLVVTRHSLFTNSKDDLTHLHIYFLSESSDSDSDSDSDDVLGGKRNKALTMEQREKVLIEIDAMDEDTDLAPNATLHTANEILQLPEVKKPNIVFGSKTKLVSIGAVMTIVDSVVVVQAFSSGEVRVLDTGTAVVVMKAKEGDGEPDKEVLGEVSCQCYLRYDGVSGREDGILIEHLLQSF